MSDLSPPAQPALPPRRQRIARHKWLLLTVGLALGGALLASTIGLNDGEPPAFGVVSLISAWLTGGLIAALWFAAAIGLGKPLARLLLGRDADASTLVWAQLALGPAAMLVLNHLLGWAGLLSGPTGRVCAIALLLIGLPLLGAQLFAFVRRRGRLPEVPGTAVLGTVGVAILLCAAASTPGWLWRSEAGGFDALSYHLPLAQEWAQAGARLAPLPHNVYSFLPSYVEAAFLHIAALLGGSLTSGEAHGVIACQYLHALFAVLAAVLVGRATTLAARRFVQHASGLATSTAGGIAAAIVIATPWSVVTGSLAYNEMAMLAMLAGAMVVALLPAEITPARRALACAVLLGVACGCKPTALFFGGPIVGLLLLITTSPRSWPAMLGIGLVGGLVAFGPPLIRNWSAAGNPVFPAGVAVFGTQRATDWGWNQKQVENFKTGHARHGTVSEQVARLFSTEPTRGTVDGEPRGMMHSQWGILWPVGLIAVIALLPRRETRTIGIALLGGTLAGCAFWVLGTHGQSRFLVPLMPGLAIAIGIGFASLTNSSAPLARVAALLGAVVPLIQSASLIKGWVVEGYARPNAALVMGAASRTGNTLASRKGELTPSEFRDRLDASSPEVYCNLTLGPDERVLLLGDATPLYFTCGTVYHSVWDRSPLGLAIERADTDPSRWTALLRETLDARSAAHGGPPIGSQTRYVLVNFGELNRYWSTYGYDPAVTPQTLLAWLGTLGEPTREWMPEVDGLMLSWHDIVREDWRRWTGRALWKLDAAPSKPAKAQPANRV